MRLAACLETEETKRTFDNKTRCKDNTIAFAIEEKLKKVALEPEMKIGPIAWVRFL